MITEHEGVTETTERPYLSVRGGCLCGGVRYHIEGRLIDAGYCHCRMCQLSSGAPVLAWFTVSNDALHYHQGRVQVYASSDTYQREFCPGCGAQIAFRKTASPHVVDVTLATLDTPHKVVPEYHIWTESQIPWLKMGDDLCRYQDAGPDQHD